jgi:hypothetical protein
MLTNTTKLSLNFNLSLDGVFPKLVSTHESLLSYVRVFYYMRVFYHNNGVAKDNGGVAKKWVCVICKKEREAFLYFEANPNPSFATLAS